MKTGALGQRIREVRLNKKLTQNDVVGEYMTRNMLSKIENGSAAPSVKTLEFLARALDVPVSYFWEGGKAERALAEDDSHLRYIDELSRDLADRVGAYGWALCIRARCMLASGKPGEALRLLKGVEPEKEADPKLTRHMYMVLEDCFREQGDYKQAYEYALKRLDNNNGLC